MSDIVNENVIEFTRNQNRATVTFCQPRYVTKIKKLAEQYPEECQITAENDDGSIVAHIPTKWVRIQPGHGREMTEEEKDILRERLENIRKSKQEDGEYRTVGQEQT